MESTLGWRGRRLEVFIMVHMGRSPESDHPSSAANQLYDFRQLTAPFLDLVSSSVREYQHPRIVVRKECKLL